MKLRTTMILAIALLMITIGALSISSIFLLARTSMAIDEVAVEFEGLRSSATMVPRSSVERIARRHAHLHEDLERARYGTYGMLLCGFMLATTALLFLRFRVLGGFEQLLDAIRTVREGGPGTLAPVWSNDDEFAEIISSVNMMSYGLAESSVNASHLRSLVDALPIPALLVSHGGGVRECSSDASAVLEVPQSEVEGHHLTSILICDEFLPAAHEQLLKNPTPDASPVTLKATTRSGSAVVLTVVPIASRTEGDSHELLITLSRSGADSLTESPRAEAP